MTGYKKSTFILKHIILVHIIYIILTLYGGLIEIITYTNSGYTKMASFLMPTCILFPFFYFIYSIILFKKKKIFESLVILFMFIYFISIPAIITGNSSIDFKLKAYKNLFIYPK